MSAYNDCDDDSDDNDNNDDDDNDDDNKGIDDNNYDDDNDSETKYCLKKCLCQTYKQLLIIVKVKVDLGSRMRPWLGDDWLLTIEIQFLI